MQSNNAVTMGRDEGDAYGCGEAVMAKRANGGANVGRRQSSMVVLEKWGCPYGGVDEGILKGMNESGGRW